MTTTNSQPDLNREQITRLALAFEALVPAELSDQTVVVAALSFICAVADASPNRHAIAEVMRRAADELERANQRFGHRAH